MISIQFNEISLKNILGYLNMNHN